MNEVKFNKIDAEKQDNVENVVDLNARRQVTSNKKSTTSLFDRNQTAKVGKDGREQVPQPTREEIDAKIEASEAKTETKFVELRGDLRLILSQISALASDISEIKSDNKITRNTVVTTGISTAIGLFGALIGLAAIAASFWYNGTVVFDHLHPH